MYKYTVLVYLILYNFLFDNVSYFMNMCLLLNDKSCMQTQNTAYLKAQHTVHSETIGMAKPINLFLLHTVDILI